MSAFPEYLSTQTVTIDGGSIEFISNYREVIQTLQQKAQKLKSEITATKLMRSLGCPFVSLNSDALTSNCSTPIDAWQLHSDFFKKLVQWIIKEQEASQGDSIGAFDAYFQEMIGYQKKYVPYYNNLIAEFQKVVNMSEYLSDKHAKICRDAKSMADEAGRLGQAGIRARKSGVYIAAPSLSALIANEETDARARAQAQSYYQQADSLYSKAGGMYFTVAKERVNEAVSIIINAVTQYIDTIIDTALNDMLVIEGAAASKKEWIDFKQNPCGAEKYVALFKNATSTVGLTELMSAFEVSRDEVYAECCDLLNRSVFDGSIQGAINKAKSSYSVLIKNLCEVYSLTEDEILYQIIALRGTYALDQLCRIKEPLPITVITAIERDISDEQICQEAVAMVNQKMSRTDFLFYLSVLGTEWGNNVRTAFAHTEEGEALYDRIVEDEVSRLSSAHKCWKAMTAVIANLQRQIAEMEDNLSNLGLFSFGAKKQLRQQIEDTKVKLRKHEAAYQHEKTKF